jgi:transposase
MGRKKKLEMEIVNPNTTGIDIGSRSHFVAVGKAEQNVKEFGVYTEDLTAICVRLTSYGITSVAMESTGDYWQNLFAELIKNDIEVILCNGKFTQHAKGKKTDLKDARWIQKLHVLGLLTSSFLPDEQTEILRTYSRQRNYIIHKAAAASRRMQKYLKFLNFRLDVVVNDVCRLIGHKIIEDICKGNLDPHLLAQHRHYNCRKSEEEIAKALHGNHRSGFLFGLKQKFETYQFMQKQLKACDKQIDRFIKDYFKAHPALKKLKTEEKPHKRENKNAPAIKNFNQLDLLAVEGLSHSTVLCIMAEIGPEGFKKFKTSKDFVSWLRLAQNNKISGGKILSTKVPKCSNRLKIALRQAANAIGNLKNTHLTDFFKKVAYRKGRQAAVSATARKLGVIIWNMITKKQAYQPPTQYLFLDQKRKLGLFKRIRKQITKFEIKPEEVGFINNSYSAR